MSEATTMTTWHCTKCGNGGTFRIASGASVPDAVEVLKEHHAFRVPQCEFDLSKMRVVPEENEDD